MPTNDYVFKRIFGRTGNEALTKDLIENILERKIDSINLEGNTILEQNLKDDKIGILDIKAKLDNNIWCDIEMQVAHKKDIAKRLLFYWSLMYISEIKKGDNYKALNKTICIMITDFELDNLKQILECHTKWQIRESKNHKIILTDVLELHIIELPKTVYDIHNDLNKNLLLWLRFIMNQKKLEEMDGMDKVSNNTKKAVKMAQEELEDINMDEYEQRIAFLRMKHILDSNSMYNDGHNDGATEKAQKIAKKLLDEGMPIEKIMYITDLSKEEISNL